MNDHTLKLIKITLCIAILLFAFGYFNNSEQETYELNADYATYYQLSSCEFSIFELNEKDNPEYNVEFISNPAGNIECFGKNNWYAYESPRLLENSVDEYTDQKIKIWINTNMSIDLIIQSFIWLVLFSLIPKNSYKTLVNKPLLIGVNTLIFYIHLIGEKNYYKMLSREYDIDIISFEYNGSLYYKNYFLYLYLITLMLISYLFIRLLETRFDNVINYLPYIFLIYGTFASLNLNIYLIFFGLLGIKSLIEKKFYKGLSFLYFIVSIFWIFNLDNKDLNFDVDKLRGFINSSQSISSIVFWIIIFYLVFSGVFYLITESLDHFSPLVFRRNLIISSSIIFLVGTLSGVNKIFNFISFYFLGLNKFGMRSLESIEGNTWRGIAPSAEGMGEFYALVILFSVIYSYEYKLKFNYYELAGMLIVIAGLSRSNNFAAMSSCLLLIILYLSVKRYGLKKNLILTVLFVIFSTSFVYVQFFREFSYSYLSSNMLYEGVKSSDMIFKVDLNQYGETQAEQANYQYILEMPQEDSNLSSSLRNLVENYTYGYNIKNVPSFISIVNVSSYLINRSEKWGIFFAKYDPGLAEFIFGYGPQQITNYYFDHPTKYNYGLFLPHSSLFNYLIFFGIFGLGVLAYLIYKNLFSQKINLISKYLVIFLILNYLKSDALLYLPNFIFTILIFNFHYFEIKKIKNE